MGAGGIQLLAAREQNVDGFIGADETRGDLRHHVVDELQAKLHLGRGRSIFFHFLAGEFSKGIGKLGANGFVRTLVGAARKLTIEFGGKILGVENVAALGILGLIGNFELADEALILFGNLDGAAVLDHGFAADGSLRRRNLEMSDSTGDKQIGRSLFGTEALVILEDLGFEDVGKGLRHVFLALGAGVGGDVEGGDIGELNGGRELAMEGDLFLSGEAATKVLRDGGWGPC